jgi:hypothetical protein
MKVDHRIDLFLRIKSFGVLRLANTEKAVCPCLKSFLLTIVFTFSVAQNTHPL